MSLYRGESSNTARLIAGDSVISGNPVGGVIIWFGIPTKIPANYLILIGKVGALQLVSKTTYPTLFDRYGYTFGGSGDNFVLPPLGGRVVVGLDSAQTEFDTLGETGGAKTHTLTVAELAKHRHSLVYINQANWNGSSWGNDPGQNTGSGNNASSMLDTGGDQPHNNLQPYIVGYYIIKVREEAYTEDLYNLDNVVSTLSYNLVTDGPAVKTGRQRDGKDEYVKSYSKQLGNNNVVYISTGLTGVKIIKYEGIQTNGTEYHCIPYPDPTDNDVYSTICWMHDVGQIRLKTLSDRTSFTAYVDVYFTYN